MHFLHFNELLEIGITYRDCNYINRKINSPYNLRLTSAKTILFLPDYFTSSSKKITDEYVLNLDEYQIYLCFIRNRYFTSNIICVQVSVLFNYVNSIGTVSAISEI